MTGPAYPTAHIDLTVTLVGDQHDGSYVSGVPCLRPACGGWGVPASRAAAGQAHPRPCVPARGGSGYGSRAYGIVSRPVPAAGAAW